MPTPGYVDVEGFPRRRLVYHGGPVWQLGQCGSFAFAGPLGHGIRLELFDFTPVSVLTGSDICGNPNTIIDTYESESDQDTLDGYAGLVEDARAANTSIPSHYARVYLKSETLTFLYVYVYTIASDGVGAYVRYFSVGTPQLQTIIDGGTLELDNAMGNGLTLDPIFSGPRGLARLTRIESPAT